MHLRQGRGVAFKIRHFPLPATTHHPPSAWHTPVIKAKWMPHTSGDQCLHGYYGCLLQHATFTLPVLFFCFLAKIKHGSSRLPAGISISRILPRKIPFRLTPSARKSCRCENLHLNCNRFWRLLRQLADFHTTESSAHSAINLHYCLNSTPLVTQQIFAATIGKHN